MVQHIPTSDRNKASDFLRVSHWGYSKHSVVYKKKPELKKNLRLLILDEKTAMTLEYKEYKIKEHNKKYLDRLFSSSNF